MLKRIIPLMGTTLFLSTAVPLITTVQVQAQSRYQTVFVVPRNQVLTVLNDLEYDAQRFRRSVDKALDRSRLNNTQPEDRLNAFLYDFQQSVKRLERQYRSGAYTADDVNTVLTQGRRISRIMPRNGNIWYQANRDWEQLNQSLERLDRITVGKQYPNRNGNYRNQDYRNGNYGDGDYQNGGYQSGGNNNIYLVSSNQVNSVLANLQQNTSQFRITVSRALNQSNLNNGRQEASINSYLAGFEQSVNQLQREYSNGEPTLDNVQQVLTQGSQIDRLISSNGFIQAQVNQDWLRLRQSLQSLDQITRGTQFPV